MIRVERSPVPAFCLKPLWRRERDRVRKFFKDPASKRRQHHFEFIMPYRTNVLEELSALFHAKCAFCERKHPKVSAINVENFRPKSGAVGKDGKLSPDHYWWLAYEWSNLYFSCVECNQSKGSRFPVEGERARIEATETEIRQEQALLLDPCVDDPEVHLVFVADGKVASNSVQGRKTIETFNLNRGTLVESRRQHASLLARQWKAITDAITKKKKIKDEVTSLTNILRGYLEPNKEFVALARCCLQQWSIEFCRDHPTEVPLFEDLMTVRTTVTPEADLEARKRTVNSLVSARIKTETGRFQVKGTLGHLSIETEVSKTVQDFQAHEAEQASYSLAVESEREKFFSQTRYVRSIEITNFKVIKHIKLTFIDTPDAGSWLLLLGENATGKSSVLQAVALALMGEKERQRLGLNDGRRLATYPKNRGDLVEGFVQPNSQVVANQSGSTSAAMNRRSGLIHPIRRSCCSGTAPRGYYQLKILNSRKVQIFQTQTISSIPFWH
jgi:uncharacterized protein (TIGR02646 family)